MADTDFNSAPKDSSSAQKPLIYDLLNRLNASFARAHRNMAALEQVGIFDPLDDAGAEPPAGAASGRRELPSARSHAPH